MHRGSERKGFKAEVCTFHKEVINYNKMAKEELTMSSCPMYFYMFLCRAGNLGVKFFP